MIVLDSSKQINFTVTSGTSVTATAHYVDKPNVVGYNVATSNGVTGVAIVPAPSSGVNRLVQYISIYNGDSVSQTVIVLFGAVTIFNGALSPGKTFQYTSSGGWLGLGTSGYSGQAAASANTYYPGGW